MEASKTLTHADVVKVLKARQGSQSAAKFSKSIGVSAQYLSDIYLNKCQIGPGVLSKLGLTKELRYRKAKA